jgi:hypothetical protein
MSVPVVADARTNRATARSAIWGAAYLLVVAVLVSVVARASDRPRWYVLTLLGAGAVVLVIAREARVYGMIDFSNPLIMTLASSVLVFGVLGAPNIRAETVSATLPLTPGTSALFRALVTIGVFMVCLWAGSRIAEPLFRIRPQRLSPLLANIRQQRVVVVVTIGAVARVLLLVSGNLGYQGYGKGGDLTGYANWLATANDLLPFAAGLMLVDWFTTRRRSSLYATATLFFVEMLTSIVAGVKGLALTLLVFLAVTTIRAGRRPKLWVAAPVVLLVLLVIAPSVEAFRVQVQHSQAPSGVFGRITAPLSLARATTGGGVNAAKNSYRNALLEEQNLVIDVALIQSRTPSVYPFEHGKRWLLAPLVAAVPRALWSGKPSLSNGGDLAVKYSGAARGTTSMPATMVGDAWIQFGWLGVIFAAFALGAFYRWAYTWVVRRRNAGWTIALCFVVSTALFSAGLDVASLLTSATREFIVLGLFAAWVVHTPARVPEPA